MESTKSLPTVVAEEIERQAPQFHALLNHIATLTLENSSPRALAPQPDAAEPIGYAVQMIDGHFVGLYVRKDTAENVAARNRSGKDNVIPVYAHAAETINAAGQELPAVQQKELPSESRGTHTGRDAANAETVQQPAPAAPTPSAVEEVEAIGKTPLAMGSDAIIEMWYRAALSIARRLDAAEQWVRELECELGRRCYHCRQPIYPGTPKKMFNPAPHAASGGVWMSVHEQCPAAAPKEKK